VDTSHFLERYKKLNPKQREAVDAIDGPVLVVAGPGSGKTEILSLRVANILRETDTHPSSILCLTFTEAAAANMRRRLADIIGTDAYRVAIHTFHSFGVEVKNRFSGYFHDGAAFLPADELTSREVLGEIFARLRHDDPLRKEHPEMGFIYLADAGMAIEALKRSGISPDELLAVVEYDEAALARINPILERVFGGTVSAKTIPAAVAAVEEIRSIDAGLAFPLTHLSPLEKVVAASLERAVQSARELGKASPLSTWKSRYLKQDDEGQRVFRDTLQMPKLRSLAGVYAAYRERMYKAGYYDFGDMLLDVIQALQSNPTLKAELQEEFQYVLVDEFQDTNDAQMRLLSLLSDNPVSEGRPNVMAVGDDDQAIFRFQGAELANILGFRSAYREPKIITLGQNYRSASEILDTASQIIALGEERLETVLPDIEKKLVSELGAGGNISVRDFQTRDKEYAWIAAEVRRLMDAGTPPGEIAVIARKHRYLEELARCFAIAGIPVEYERERNVLEQPHVAKIIQIARYAVSLLEVGTEPADYLLPEILSYPFWGISREAIWKLSVEASAKRLPWLSIALESPEKTVQSAALFLLDLSREAKHETLEHMLDRIIGPGAPGRSETDEDAEAFDTAGRTGKEAGVASLFRNYYFSSARFDALPGEYLLLLSGLRTFVEALRKWRRGMPLELADLVAFADLRTSHNMPLLDRSPVRFADKAVRLLTAHGAKGLEFEAVFVVSCQDDIWAGRGFPARLPLPANLPVMPGSDTSDDKLRLFYVALTRAKRHLYLTSFAAEENGKASPRLRFLEAIGEIGTVSPADAEDLQNSEAAAGMFDMTLSAPPYAATESAVLAGLLDGYQMSVTHLNNFLDVTRGGPRMFFEQNLLRFPQAKSGSESYGSAIHRTMEFIYRTVAAEGSVPALPRVLGIFETELERERLSERDLGLYKERGFDAIRVLYDAKKDSIDPSDKVEVDFRSQGVIIENAPITGKIDRLHVEDGRATVIDIKTGRALDTWEPGTAHEKEKLHRYARQLVFYKLLVEHSRSFAGKAEVQEGVLEFAEPAKGKILELRKDITQDETERLVLLIKAVYAKIQALDFPDTSGYKDDLSGMLQFEEDLLTGVL
jgi:DNA helicase II / ATP-dependent DNA helicase PcrA